MIVHFLRAEWQDYKDLLRKVPSLALTVFILSVVCMNLLANKELFHTSWVALDCGFALSWIPFLLMDCTCKVYGGKAAAKLSILAIAVNLIMFGLFKLLAATPGMWGAYYATALPEVNAALNDTIGGSAWIVWASALAMLVSSLVNSAVNMSVARLLHKDNYATFAARSFLSTALAQFVDNLVFAFVVSVPLFGWNIRQAVMCSLTAAGFELLLEIAFSHVGYTMAKSWNKDQTVNPHP